MKGLRYLKINMAIAIVLLIFICSGIVIQYNKVKSTIIIGTTSSIKLNINSFNKVIYVHSPTEKGTDLIDSLNLVNKDIDTAVEEIFDYAANNNMISEDKKVLITISGDSLNYGTFNKTNKFTTENNINLIINNSGNQQTLPKYIEDGETN